MLILARVRRKSCYEYEYSHTPLDDVFTGTTEFRARDTAQQET